MYNAGHQARAKGTSKSPLTVRELVAMFVICVTVRELVVRFVV